MYNTILLMEQSLKQRFNEQLHSLSVSFLCLLRVFFLFSFDLSSRMFALRTQDLRTFLCSLFF